MNNSNGGPNRNNNNQRRNRGRTPSTSSNVSRREYTPRPGSQPEQVQPIIEPQPQLVAAPPGYQYIYTPHYYQPHPGAPAGVATHPQMPGTTAATATGQPIFFSPVPVYNTMYGYPQGGVVYSLVPEQYAPVDDKSVVGEEAGSDVPPPWSPTLDYQQEVNQMGGNEPVMEDSYVQTVIDDGAGGTVVVEEPPNSGLTIPILRPPPIIHQVPHVLNPNVSNFTLVNQPEQMQAQHFQPQPPQPAPAIVAAAPPPQQNDFTGSLSPVNMMQAYAKVSQVTMASTDTEQNQTFVQAAASVTVVNNTQNYAVSEPASTPGAEQQVTIEEVSGTTNNNNIIKQNYNQVTSSNSVMMPAPLPQRVKPESQVKAIQHNAIQENINNIQNGNVNAVNNSGGNNQQQQNVPNTPRTTPTTSDEVNKITKQLAEKASITKQQQQQQSNNEKFGGPNNKPVAWGQTKKTTGSVAVSAIPNKDNVKQTQQPTQQSQQQQVQSQQLSAPQVAFPVLPNFSTPPPPFPTTFAHPPPAHPPQTQPYRQQQYERKPDFRADQHNKEVTANVAEKKPVPPPPSSFAPPPQPVEEQQNKQPSWASLFQSSKPTQSLPQASFENGKRPVAKVSPFEGTTVTPSTPQPPIGGISYSAASAQGLATQQQQQQHQVQRTTNTVNPTVNTTNIATATVIAEKRVISNERSKELANYFNEYKLDNNGISIFPRGLINRSNYCYINAILQALVSCPPLYHMMKDMPKPTPAQREKSVTPIIDAVQELFSNFVPRKVVRDRTHPNPQPVELVTDNPFEPVMIYKMMSGIRSEIFEGRQEDAEEFLGCILNRLNDEMLEVSTE